jgi:hypothetical protein
VRRGLGRRTLFFLSLVAISALLYYPTPPEFRWVCLFTGALSAFWAVMVAIEDATVPRFEPGRAGFPGPALQEMPFRPPPRPRERA